MDLLHKEEISYNEGKNKSRCLRVLQVNSCPDWYCKKSCTGNNYNLVNKMGKGREGDWKNEYYRRMFLIRANEINYNTTKIRPARYAYHHIRVTLYGVGFKALRWSCLKIFREFFTRSWISFNGGNGLQIYWKNRFKEKKPMSSTSISNNELKKFHHAKNAPLYYDFIHPSWRIKRFTHWNDSFVCWWEIYRLSSN